MVERAVWHEVWVQVIAGVLAAAIVAAAGLLIRRMRGGQRQNAGAAEVPNEVVQGGVVQDAAGPGGINVANTTGNVTIHSAPSVSTLSPDDAADAQLRARRREEDQVDNLAREAQTLILVLRSDLAEFGGAVERGQTGAEAANRIDVEHERWPVLRQALDGLRNSGLVETINFWVEDVHHYTCVAEDAPDVVRLRSLYDDSERLLGRLNPYLVRRP